MVGRNLSVEVFPPPTFCSGGERLPRGHLERLCVCPAGGASAAGPRLILLSVMLCSKQRGCCAGFPWCPGFFPVLHTGGLARNTFLKACESE